MQAAVIVAGGSGTRFGGNKLLTPLHGVPVIAYSLRLFAELMPCVAVVVPPALKATYRAVAQEYAPGGNFIWAEAGAVRADSVRSGLAALPEEVSLVAVHDAARPLITASLVRRVMAEAERTGAAIPGRPVVDTLQRTGADGVIVETVDRANLYRVETPQCFRLALLRRALANPAARECTDDAAAMRLAGFPVSMVPHREDNDKLTYPEDAARFEFLLDLREKSGI